MKGNWQHLMMDINMVLVPIRSKYPQNFRGNLSSTKTVDEKPSTFPEISTYCIKATALQIALQTKTAHKINDL